MRSKTKIPKCLCQNYTNTKARYVVHNDTGGSYTGQFLCKNAHFKSFYDIINISAISILFATKMMNCQVIITTILTFHLESIVTKL